MSRFHEAFFMATHNSFQVGLGLSIREQLDIGVRCLELDLNVGNYAAVGDFQIGHEDPGVDVLGGMGEDLLDDRPPIPAAKANPQRLAPFKEWIGVAAQWSRQNPGHAPLTIYLDLKDNLAGRAAGQGSLDDVDQAIEDVFGGSLFARRDLHGAWPDVAVLAGRVLCVLSGSPQSRFAYSERVLANQAAFLELQGDDLHLFVPPATLDRLRQNALF